VCSAVPIPGVKAYSSEMPHDRHDRQDDGAEHDAGVPAPVPDRGPGADGQQRKAEQEEGGAGGRRRTAGEHRRERGDGVGEEQLVESQIEAQDVLGHHRSRHHGSEPGSHELQPGQPNAQREQAHAGEHEQHRDQRLSRGKERGVGEQRFDPEHVALHHRDAEADRDQGGQDRELSSSGDRGGAIGRRRGRPRRHRGGWLHHEPLCDSGSAIGPEICPGL
jgi:hypothetical protein